MADAGCSSASLLFFHVVQVNSLLLFSIQVRRGRNQTGNCMVVQSSGSCHLLQSPRQHPTKSHITQTKVITRSTMTTDLPIQSGGSSCFDRNVCNEGVLDAGVDMVTLAQDGQEKSGSAEVVRCRSEEAVTVMVLRE
jgi:hypothetical protein